MSLFLSWTRRFSMLAVALLAVALLSNSVVAAPELVQPNPEALGSGCGIEAADIDRLLRLPELVEPAAAKATPPASAVIVDVSCALTPMS